MSAHRVAKAAVNVAKGVVKAAVNAASAVQTRLQRAMPQRPI